MCQGKAGKQCIRVTLGNNVSGQSWETMCQGNAGQQCVRVTLGNNVSG